MANKVVIIGGVAGGASAATRLRRLDEQAQITIIEKGEYISYANCGLPYHIGNVIKQRSSLLLLTPEVMKQKYNIDVFIKQEVTSIDRANKKVTVKKSDNSEYQLDYDKLIISTGSSPIKPPIPGIDSSRIMTLWSVPDTDRIKAYISDKNVKSAVVVGGGFIGLEMAENLKAIGLKVTIVEMLNQVMTPLDYEMAQLIHENIEQSGIRLILNNGVASFSEKGTGVTVCLKNNEELYADLVLLSIGVRPNSELGKNAGLPLNAKGGIVTDEHMRTADEDIYAVGDVIEVEDFIDKTKTMIPLAGPANKQGRIAADNIAGLNSSYAGTQGTSIVRIFDLIAANTGYNEKYMLKKGFIKGKDYETVIITQNSHAGYYPGALPLTLKLIFAKDGSKIYGAQIVGRDGVDKRIDTIATAMRLNANVYDLKDLEFAYAPPFSSAKDPVNMAGFVAENLLKGLVRFAEWDSIEKDKDMLILDIREDAERMAFTLPNTVNIPLGQLRNRIDELDKDKHILIFCTIGVRSYNASRLLTEKGFTKVSVYPAGTRFYISTHYKEFQMEDHASYFVSDSGRQGDDKAMASISLDCSGLQCPGPIMKVFETLKTMAPGQTLEVTASDPGFSRDISAWCRRTGNTLVSNDKVGSTYVAVVKKGGGSVSVPAQVGNDGKTIIVFDGDLDKVIASFIIANGAAAMGRRVTMFFTFWGLNVLRKTKKQKVKKSFLEAMFGMMMPRGISKLKLSKMNMGGMGTALMKKIMRDKNVDSLEDLVKKAMKAGVKIVACTMSMDVMGIKEEELIDGVELGGVGAYLADAEESNVNLFI
ncbi:MAG TPA: FAD-dependent oxidoreductase [Clostridia bacterium]|jgi:NADPH-dependent 2,4-dienoyl-CoA reductase/sulfur reductase-like enzyme/peroxiredoxin family protein/TusA-related sulfurtransferase/rhodanese-related sulfurtransferase|nr:FAD-dependent oxidoreductase [Clostridia bacterium]NLV34236.1 FAD-dependent oxidoreductase [Clostridiaceae bacterium]HQM96025.1 FAD-dependent oxidoreductase [Clostridia bacterium]